MHTLDELAATCLRRYSGEMSPHKISYNPKLNTTESLMRMNLRLFPPRMDGKRVIYHSTLLRTHFTKGWSLPPCRHSSAWNHDQRYNLFSQTLKTLYERTSRQEEWVVRYCRFIYGTSYIYIYTHTHTHTY
jgi:hypothetical protein